MTAKIRVGFVICMLIVSNIYSQRQTSISFVHGLSWNEIIHKAKAENRYIFLDCYTTWCGPCQRMGKEIYTLPEVRAYADSQFISVKIQLDTAKGDDQDTRRMYAQAAMIGRRYDIRAYPSYLFLSPDGDIVHRGVGFLEGKRFLSLLRDAVDSNRQYYTLLKKYRAGRIDVGQVSYLVTGLVKIGQVEVGREVSEDYIDNVLLRLQEDSLFTPENIVFVAACLNDRNDESYRWFYKHSCRIDSVVGKGFASKTIRRLITRLEITPVIEKWDSAKDENISNKEWAELKDGIAKKYDQDLAERCVIDAKIKWYSKRSIWKELVDLNLAKINKYGLDTSTYNNCVDINNLAYTVIFEHSSDNKALDKAIEWMQIVCRKFPASPNYMDTYANLIYKKGDKDQAIALEEKAIELFKGKKVDSDVLVNLDKMKRGERTWGRE